MAITFKLYTDAGLTSEFVGNLYSGHNVTGSTGRVDNVLYLGSTAASKTLEADSDPGVDQITLTPTDSSAGSGQEASAIKLALSQAGLNSAVAGDPLNLGTQVLSGVPNSVAIWIGVEANDLTVGTSTELSITPNNVRES